MKKEPQKSMGDQGPLDLETMLAFLEGRLSAEREAEIEARLEQSPEDVAALEALERQLEEKGAGEIEGMEMAFLKGLDFLGAMESREDNDELDGLENPDNTNDQTPSQAMPKRSSNRIFWVVGLAASLVLLVYFSIGLFDQPAPPQDLYAAYYSPYEDVYTEREHIESALEMDQAMADYNQKNYPVALKNFKAILGMRPGHTLAGLYAGICLLEMEEPEEAIGYFKPLAEGETTMQPMAAWYMAMTELKRDNSGEARKWLEGLTEEQGSMGRQAKELLDELEE